jgi:ABC-2 type transport system permease protein
MRKVGALLRAGFLTATSYRMNILMTVSLVAFQVVPTYYIGRTLQPFMAPSISGEGSDFFTFLIIGTAAYMFLAMAVDALPRAVSDGISTGTLEALFGAPVSRAALVVGLSGYELLWTVTKVAVLLAVAGLLGAQIAWERLPVVAPIFGLIVLSYAAVGLVAASLIIAFRRAGPVQAIVVVLSGVLGGVTYPTTMIPDWIRQVSDVIPLTYGLRAIRRLVIDEQPLSAAAADVSVLSMMTAVGLAFGSLCFVMSLRYARRTGGLAQY